MSDFVANIEVFNKADAAFNLDSFANRLSELQIEHCKWQEKSFGNRDGVSTGLAVMALGIIEEANFELVTAVESGDGEATYDSLGDILIYTCAACTALKLNFAEICGGFNPDDVAVPVGDPMMEFFKVLGRFAQIVGKAEQKTRGFDDWEKVRLYGATALNQICKIVQWFMFNNDWDGSVLFEDVLQKVMRRDWSKNQLNGNAYCENS